MPDDFQSAGYSAFRRDAVLQRDVKLALSESLNQLDLVLNAAGMGTWSVDVVTRQRYFDPRMCHLLGLDPSTFKGTSEEFYAVVHPEDREHIKTALEHAIRADSFYQQNYRVLLPDKTVHHVASRGRLIHDKHGRKLSMAGVFWDISEEKEQLAKSMLVSRMVSLGEMSTGIAHEINNPINGIINCAQLLINRLPEVDSNRKIADRIKQDGFRIARIVKSLLSVANPNRQQWETVSIREVIDDVLVLYLKQFEKDGVDLVCDIPENLPALKCIRQQIEQLLLNLLSNALYALNDRFPTMHSDKKLWIRVRCHKAAEIRSFYLEVYDQGCGISSENVNKVMDPFYTTKPAGAGTGLGLSLCYEIAKMHGGNMTIKSEFDSFTSVMVEFPLRADA